MPEAMFTIGYQGASLERLVQTLTDAEVTVLLDTRESDPGACHRSLLAHEIEGLLDVEAVHLDPRRVDKPDDDGGVLRGSHSNRGAAPSS